jgi:hypothetical protein
MLRFNLFSAAVLSSLLAATPTLAHAQTGAARNQSVTALSARDPDGNAFDVRIENGKVVLLKINGDDVALDRARQTDTSVEVLGENGEVLHRFPVVISSTMAPAVPGTPTPPRAPIAPKAPKRATAAKSMIGVGFGAVDEALAHHLKVDPEKTTMVSSVLEGLPAQKAGIEKFDVIVGVNGKDTAAIDALRSAVATAEPGAKMKLSIRRGAETKEVEVETIAFDSARLESIDGTAWGGDTQDFADMNIAGDEDGQSTMFFIGPDGKRREMRVPSLRGLAVPSVPRLDPRQFEEMERSIRELIERMDGDMKGDMNGDMHGAVDEPAPGRAPDAARRPAKPSPDAAPGRAPQKRGAESSDERLRRMEERMEDLRRELEREREARRGQKPADA